MLASSRLLFSARRLLSALALMAWLDPSLAAGNAPPGTPGSITVGMASITYFARSGDTLMTIAQQFTDKGSNWVAIGKLNRINQDSAIPIGTAILIPGELLGEVPAQATVVAMTGDISASAADGSATRLGLRATVVEGTRIQTGINSFLTLELADKSRISVPSNSRVQIAKLRAAKYINSPRTQMLLLRGRVESRVSPLEANRGRFEVRTPLSVAGVRGTNFRVGYIAESAGPIATETVSGKVAVATTANAAAPDGLLLSAGKGAVTDARAVGAAIDLLPAPRLMPPAGGGPTEYASARIAILAVPGARAYHLQIATDPAVENLIAEARSPSTVLTIEGVPDGDYYTRLSAIDRFGLEGFVSTEPLSLRARRDTTNLPGPPAVGGSDERSITLRWAQPAGQPMRLQLARDSEFSYLLANRVSSSGEARLARPAFGTYYARVQVLDAEGNVRASSLVQPLIITDQWVMNDGNPVEAKAGHTAPGR